MAATKTSPDKKPPRAKGRHKDSDGPVGADSTTPESTPPAVVDSGDPQDIKEPAAGELVPAYPEDVYRALSVADERQIAQELQGRAPKEMLYGFRQDGHQVVGLSWKGVREAVRQVNTRGYGRIHIDKDVPPKFEDVTVDVDTGKTDEDDHPLTEERKAIRVTVYARDEMHGGGNFGTATQLCEMRLKQKGKDGKAIWKPDAFAATKALSKAERNAMEPMIPLELVEELKTLYKGEGSVEYIPGVGKEVTEERPPALDDEKAKGQIAKCRELYDELKTVAGLSVFPPARFNQLLTAAQHSHDRLDDYIAHLEDLIRQVKEKQADA
jgi:hypothetical protein